MSLYDWLLFLHVLSAFAIVAADVLFSFLLVALWRRDLPSDFARLFGVSRLGTIVVSAGSIGALVFGIALAFEADSYAIWDAWIVAGIVLWVALSELGRRAGVAYEAVGKRARGLVAEGRDTPNSELAASFRSPSALALHVASMAVILLLLLDMIFKPGA
jgi:uncharacterized membrane protein